MPPLYQIDHGAPRAWYDNVEDSDGAVMARTGCLLHAVSAAALACASGCSENGGATSDAGSWDTICPPGLQARGPACVPVLDDCTGDQVPVPGGGCKQIGVEECTGGIKGPPDWTCKPIGPPTTCLTGWAKVSGGWCEPILPAAACPAGTMEVLGKSTCQPVGDCGSGTWGKIQVGAQTLYVDQSYSGTDSDGSKDKPFTTIGDALAAATAGAQIAVAAGTYAEDLKIDKQVSLEGRCPSMVTIKGQDTTLGGGAVEIRADDTLVRGFTITGPAGGVLADKARCTVEQAVVENCVGGVAARDGGDVTVRDARIVNNSMAGAGVLDAELTVERSVIQNTTVLGLLQQYGQGLVATGGATNKITVRDSLIDHNTTMGAGISAGSATLERTVVRDTQPVPVSKVGGGGVWASLGTTLVLRDCVIAGNRANGVGLGGATATIERTVVRDTELQATDDSFGIGISAWIEGQTPTTLTLKDSLVVNSASGGVGIFDSKGTLERTVVRDTRPAPKGGAAGVGIYTGPLGSSPAAPPELAISDCLVSGNSGAGISIGGATATLERTVVRDTESDNSGGSPGSGVVVWSVLPHAGNATMRDCVLANNRYVGLAVFNATVAVERSVVRDTRPAVQYDAFGFGVYAGHPAGQTEVGPPAALTLSDCLVLRNRGTGVRVVSSKATVQRCAVRETATDAQSGYGDGIAADSSVGGLRSTVEVSDSLVASSARAGLLLDDTGGAVKRSVLRKGIFSIALEGDADPTVEENNLFEGNDEDRITFGKGLSAPPPLTLPPPPPSPVHAP
jgi:hypothetical protein